MFTVRQVGGVTTPSARRRHKEQQQLFIDMRFATPAPGHVRDDLYELQPPWQAGEALPPRPHSPPAFDTDSDSDELLQEMNG